MTTDGGNADADDVRHLDARMEQLARRVASVEFRMTPSTMAVEDCLAFWVGAVLGAIVVTIVITLAGRRRRNARKRNSE